ncbi:MAG: helix-turn-helix transcriptional regulator [Saprospiraceae bacterium]|uniref:Helix-turn-helix transcriptional regulator n=1 Tax=Candidatus Opimibacter skivensis TaxID=2982028 RepID=A0A9D7SXN1_9BACT|nr:helix-turn-helix transcriptional regulator [Candidatus Opimibacter skivensis]
MSYSHQLGMVIRSTRESRGFSQDYMSEMLDIAQSTYANIESGKTLITMDRLLHIAQILEINIHQMIDQVSLIAGKDYFQMSASTPSRHDLIPDTREAYDQLIIEMKSEINFLRGIVNNSVKG